MRDYTSNNFCDFLWINDLLELKQNANKEFILEVKNKGKSNKISISGVIIFGTIVEVKQKGCNGFLYHVDDGTGVMPCNHSVEQFQQLISSIESEQADILNLTLDYSVSDTSANDSIFNDRSIQYDEAVFNQKSRLMGLQSIWDDIYKSFNCLIQPYTIGDSVVVQGRLYSYINKNQIYINCIRPLDIAEEIVLISVKLEDGLDKSEEKGVSKSDTKNPTKRLSGLMTFDTISCLNPKSTNPRNIESPEINAEVLGSISGTVTPNRDTTMTFDTFTSKKMH